MCAFIILVNGFLNAQLVSNACFFKVIILNFLYDANHATVFVRMAQTLTICIRQVRFWENPRKPKFRVWPFGFGSVRFGFLKLYVNLIICKPVNVFVACMRVCVYVCVPMKMLDRMRRQFTQLLYDMKFLSNPNPKAAESNRNSSMITVLLL